MIMFFGKKEKIKDKFFCLFTNQWGMYKMLTGKELCNVLVRENKLNHVDSFGRIVCFDSDSKLILSKVLFQSLLDYGQIQVSSINVSSHIKYINIFNGWSNPTIEVEFDCSLSPFEVIFSQGGENRVVGLFPAYRVGWQLGKRLGLHENEKQSNSSISAKAWHYGKML